MSALTVKILNLIAVKPNFDLYNLVTPVNVDVLEQLLRESSYDETETEFLINGFRNGFSIGYRGPLNRQSRSRNIPFTVGNKEILWLKLLKEVGLKRVAGPFNSIPFRFYMQSPIGLVPKDNGQDTRLIFHLSFDFPDGLGSLNVNTRRDECSVRYNNLDHAVRLILDLVGLADQSSVPLPVYLAKSDLRSAFRVLPFSRDSWPWVIMKATNPETNVEQFFVDKCLPFGASVSCSHFQQVSDALKHLLQFRVQQWEVVSNYLDDFLFLAFLEQECNRLVHNFITICGEIQFPITLDKTVCATLRLVFLGILLDGERFLLGIPEEKRS